MFIEYQGGTYGTPPYCDYLRFEINIKTTFIFFLSKNRHLLERLANSERVKVFDYDEIIFTLTIYLIQFLYIYSML